MEISIRKNAIWLVPVAMLCASAIISHHLLHSNDGAAGRVGREAGGIISMIARYPSTSVGFRNVIGDMAWLSAIQVVGGKSGVLTKDECEELYADIDAAVTLDPRFKIPYLLGATFLGDLTEYGPQAIDLLVRARRNHPDYWRFPFHEGYVRYFTMGDLAGASKAMEAASVIPGAPPYLPLLTARMFAEGRVPETAIAFLVGMIKDEKDEGRRQRLDVRLREVVVERDIQMLEKAAEAYFADTGRKLASLEELVRSGVIREIPHEPGGGRYLLKQDGSIVSSTHPERLKVFKRR